MMIVVFWPHQTQDVGSHFEILEYAVDSAGYMVQKATSKGQLSFGLPLGPDVFTPNQPKILGLAQYSNRVNQRTGKMVYEFSELTPELVSTLLFGPLTDQKFTVIADELNTKVCWSKGIKNIYFV